VDPTVVNYDYFPVKSWHQFLRRWALRRDLDEFKETAGKQRSTLRTMCRAVDADADRMPAFPLTKAPNRGQNQIRLRLLSGTAALNGTISHFTERTTKCPFACNEEEDAAHFLLHCNAMADLRQEYESRLTDSCECDRRIGSGGEVGCSDFFTGLDDDGKVLFMLGGPVDGREPELSIDCAAKRFVALAYERRSARLNQDADEPLVVDLTTGGALRNASQKARSSSSILSFFSPTTSTHHTACRSAGASSPRVNACARHVAAAACAHAAHVVHVVPASVARAHIARPNRSSDALPSSEPGVDSMTHKSRGAS
jgi:hypothetical protein